MIDKMLMTSKNRLNICLVAHAAYGAVSCRADGHIGGVERQTSLMAKWLVARGHRVSMMTWDEMQEDGVAIGGVQIFKMCRKNSGVKVLRFFWPKWTSLIAAMKRADADIYYQNCAEYVTGQVALWCRWHGRKFVYSVANDPDCDGRLPRMHTLRERVLYRYGLQAADMVIVQSRRQKEMLQADFGRKSVLNLMPCPGPSEDDYVGCRRDRNDSKRILWIGRICEVKRPDRLLDIAESCPELNFDLVGPVYDSEYARSVCRRAKTLANVTLHGPATRECVPEFYRMAKIMCCTSDFEGFPNTFLEAWSYGLPIVSTFDPDGIIAKNGLGAVREDVPRLVVGIRNILNSPDLWRVASLAARKYYVENHTLDGAMRRFERVFLDAVNGVLVV